MGFTSPSCQEKKKKQASKPPLVNQTIVISTPTKRHTFIMWVWICVAVHFDKYSKVIMCDPLSRLSFAYKALLLCYICCQRCELRVSKSLIPVVSLDFLSLKVKGLNALELSVIISKVYLALFVLTSSIKLKPCCSKQKTQKCLHCEVPLNCVAS